MSSKKISQHTAKRMLVLSLAFLSATYRFADTAEEYMQRFFAMFNKDFSRETNIKSENQKMDMKATFAQEGEQMFECYSTTHEQKEKARNLALDQRPTHHSYKLKKN